MSYHSRRDPLPAISAAIFILIVLLVLAVPLLSNAQKTDVTGYVTNTYIKTESNKGVYYVVLKLDNGTSEVFVDQDSSLNGKWNSSDYFSTLTDDWRAKRHIKITVIGWRNTLFSGYRNIVAIQNIGK